MLFPHLKALTEPEYGSDASALKTIATKVLALNFFSIYLSTTNNTSFHTYFHMWNFMFLLLHWDDQVEGGWILEGQKRWIGNSTFADLLVIFARNTTTNQING